MEMIKEYTKFMLLAIVLGVIFTCLIGVLLAYTNINDNMMGTLIFVGTGISILISSLLLNRKIKKRGYLYGLIFGLIFFILIYTFSSLAASSLIMNTTVLVYLIMSIFMRSYRRNNWCKCLRRIMNIDFLKVKNKKVIAFGVLLLFLIISYIVVGYIESKAAFSNENELEDTLKNMKICIGGEAVGIKILATGVLVMSAENQPNLHIGDIILEINGVTIDSNNQLINEVQKTNGKDIILKIDRNSEIKNIKVDANYSDTTNSYELGIWVKDSSAGVGTISFYDKKNMRFASLGHGITETSNNVIIPINSGGIVKTKITEITKGERKSPGDIKGILYTNVLGQIIKNTQYGIYGILEEDICKNKEEIDVATKLEIKEGKAKIYCTLDNNKVEEFEINIERILYNSSGNKNMVIKITDEKLLEKTGGIVQGMSGSPIVQNNKLIGAITHVFYNDPTQGYAVFAETMISDMANIK